MRFKGLSKTKVLRTPEDVLEHSYGRKAEGTSPSAKPPVPPAEVEEVEMTEDEYAASLVDGNLKEKLVEMAEEYGLDVDGNKADIAARIAAREYSE